MIFLWQYIDTFKFCIVPSLVLRVVHFHLLTYRPDFVFNCRWIHAALPGRVNRVTFSPGHPGLTRFTNYPGLTRIGSCEKQNCSFDNVETYKRYRVALS